MSVQTEQKKRDDVNALRPIDDVFFEVLVEEPGVCEEMLRTILEDRNLVVEDVIPQRSERNIFGRSVRLDALCTLSSGVKCNIEVQRSNDDDHLRRARFNASSITMKCSNPGEHFEDVIELYIVYISDFDFLKKKKTIYHIEKCIRETGDFIDDGLHEIFVNTAVDDKTDIAELMNCFKQTTVDNPKFPKLSAAVRRLKTTEGGISTMCKVMEESNRRANMDLLFGLVVKGALSLENAAKELNISVEKLLSEMQLYGYTTPQKTA